jgi:hypothetical protein
MLDSKKNIGGVQVAQLFGPGSGKQEAQGKEHRTQRSPVGLTLDPVAHLMQIVLVEFV